MAIGPSKWDVTTIRSKLLLVTQGNNSNIKSEADVSDIMGERMGRSLAMIEQLGKPGKAGKLDICRKYDSTMRVVVNPTYLHTPVLCSDFGASLLCAAVRTVLCFTKGL